MTLALIGNTLLRTAITRNLVTFPAQVLPLMKRANGDVQERVVQLYFVRGWPVRSICERYGMGKAMVHKLLAEWRIRAIESGYIQEIEPGCLAVLQPESSGIAKIAPREQIAAELPLPKPAHMSFSNPLPGSVPAAERAATLSAARSA